MTPIDSLAIGDWVCVIGTTDPTSPYGECMRSYNGHPYQVLAISLPFIAVNNGKRTAAIDAREYSVQRVSEEYALAMAGHIPSKVKKRRDMIRGRIEKFHRLFKEKDRGDGHARCIRCGSRLVQRMVTERVAKKPGVADRPHTSWHWSCPECDWDGGLVEKEVKT